MQTARIAIDKRVGFYQFDEDYFTQNRPMLRLFIGQALSDVRYTNFDDAREAVLTVLELYDFDRRNITVTESDASKLEREPLKPSYV